MADADLKAIFSDVIRYWEKLRLVYNLGLALVVLMTFVLGLPETMDRLQSMLAVQLFMLAFIANVLFTSAYAVDVFVQLSAFRETWLQYRWLLFLAGFLFALIIAWFMSHGILAVQV